MTRLGVIVASTRPGRVGPQIGEWFVEVARRHGDFDVDVLDLATIGLPFHNEPHHPSERSYVYGHTRQWSAMIEAAEAFVFVMPEYNRGFSAPLKNAIDYLYEEWQYKPVGFVSYGMTSAGLRAVEMIKQVVTTLRMMPVTDAVCIHLRQALVGGVFSATDHMDETAVEMLDELGRLSHALTAMRAPATAGTES